MATIIGNPLNKKENVIILTIIPMKWAMHHACDQFITFFLESIKGNTWQLWYTFSAEGVSTGSLEYGSTTRNTIGAIVVNSDLVQNFTPNLKIYIKNLLF